jgi:pyruvate dehydrogenase E2 component (dihydrolipoamide acetyltransferase)
MAIRTFNLPDPGEGLVEAEIIEWKVKPGDEVKVNDIVLEIETAKSLVELPIPWSGTVHEILVQVGDTVDVGTPIITIDDGQGGAAAPEAPAAVSPSIPGEKAEPVAGQEAILVGYGAKAGAVARRPRKSPTGMPQGSASVAAAFQRGPEAADREAVAQRAQAPAAESETRVPALATPAPTAPAPAAPTAPAPAAPANGRPKAKPPVRKLAKDLGVDLTQVTPTGAEGVITRDDVQAFASGGAAASAPAQAGAVMAAGPAAYGTGERETRIPIKGVRKMTAQAMVGSAFTAPHVTEWITVDVTRTMELVERLKKDREFREVKVTPLLVLAKAMCVAVRRNPEINATWDEAAQEIIVKNYVNLGIAAATPRGLIVPNIKDADRMSMLEIAQAIGELTATAREGRTQPADMSGGTITITNVGVFGVDAGTPILNPGESAIMAFGAIRRMPWVVTAADGTETIEPRWVTQLALSFDHRLVDGELGSRYIADVAALLEDPSRGLVWG